MIFGDRGDTQKGESLILEAIRVLAKLNGEQGYDRQKPGLKRDLNFRLRRTNGRQTCDATLYKMRTRPVNNAHN